MVLIVNRKTKIVFTIQTNRNLNQIRNYCVNTLIPRMVNRFEFHFSAAPFKQVDFSEARIVNRGGGQFEIYPAFGFSVDIVNETHADEARQAWQNFIEDCRDSLRDLIAGLQGTTLLSVHYHTANGDTVEMEF